jgi:hypothetical protein
MPPPIRLVPLALVLPALCSCSLFAPRPAGVAMRFAWPEDLTGRVTHTHSVVADGEALVLEVHRTFQLKVEPGEKQGQRRLVSTLTEASPAEFAEGLDPEATVIFDREGAFVGIEQPAESASMDMVRQMQLSPEEEIEARHEVELKLERQAQEKWIRHVARWRGATLFPREIVRFSTKAWIGRSPAERRQVEAEERNTLEAQVPCTPADVKRRCVRIRVELVPLVPSEDGKMNKATVSFELVTEPSTLLPYFSRLLRTEEVALGFIGQETTHEFTQMDEYVFSYGDEPPGQGDVDAPAAPEAAPMKP